MRETKKIYSNVDSKIVQNNGRDVFIGEGFESDEEFKDWRFRRMKGRMGGRDEAERRLRGHGFHVRAPGSETLRQPALRQSVRRPDVRIREGRSGPGDSRRAG